MYHVSAQGIDERMINVHYYYVQELRVKCLPCCHLAWDVSLSYVLVGQTDGTGIDYWTMEWYLLKETAKRKWAIPSSLDIDAEITRTAGI